MSNTSMQERAINTIRFLSADGVQKANSGHPGLPMGAAAIAYTVWTKHLRFNPKNPKWFDRDRFVLSGGHGSMLLYSLLHLTGYDLPLEQLKQFRQWGSLTPGHPEAGLTPGIETTTGPLGQGLGNGIGMAVAEAHLAALYNKPGHEIINHTTYIIVGDGDLMEGVASEASSFAGHQKLGKIICFYDDNKITIDGSTDLAFTEDRGKRFEAYGWQVLRVDDGNDVAMIDRAIKKAKKDPRPSLIMCKTIIGYGMPNKQGTAKAHGEPPGEEELLAAKEKLGWPKESFYIPDDVAREFKKCVSKGKKLEADWNKRFSAYKAAYPVEAAELERRISGKLPEDWEKALPVFETDAKGMASRVASGKVINSLVTAVPELIGGSADLAPSNNTWISSSVAFQADHREGKNFHFGVREHGMASIVNGITVHGGIRPYGATFLVFADYCRGALRVSALSHIPSIWVFTHDSIGLGEDGPTHQPVETLASLRVIPNLLVIRPADANETAEAWRVALLNNKRPTALALSRQNLPTLDRKTLAPASGLQKGAYVLLDPAGKKPEIILMASGSEVGLVLDAAQKLSSEGKAVRVVSFPSWELFSEQSAEYRESVLPASVTKRVAVEAGCTFGWEKWVGDKGVVIGLDRFGASAPAKVVMEKLGFSIDHVVEEAKKLLG
ncbi:MAG: transketolase [Leptolinea sp.]|jgi:transketolase|nr:transketolase [Leptolinea sp.]